MKVIRFIYQYLRLFVRLVYLFLTNRKIGLEQYRCSFDLLSLRFDPDWEKSIYPAIENLFGRTTLRSSHNLLDLGDNTGLTAISLGKEYRNVKIYVLNSSSGLAGLIQKRVKDLNIANEEVVCGELTANLKKFPQENFDGAFCVFPKELLPKTVFKEIFRVLKKGAILGMLIEAKDSTPEIRKVWRQLQLKHAGSLQRIMINSRPASLNELKKSVSFNGLRVLESWSGEIKIPYNSGSEALEKMLNSGALAGYEACLNLRDDAKTKTDFAQLIEKTGHTVTHHYFGLVAERRMK
ncbi:MAG: methyltransferase domain-containing protein [Elusimicrobiota bacterium]